MVSITFYGEYLRIVELRILEKYSHSNQIIEMKQFSPKQNSNSNTKKSINLTTTPIIWKCDAFY